MIDRSSGFGKPAPPTIPAPFRNDAQEERTRKESLLDSKIMAAAKVVARLNGLSSRYRLQNTSPARLPGLRLFTKPPAATGWHIDTQAAEEFAIDETME